MLCEKPLILRNPAIQPSNSISDFNFRLPTQQRLDLPDIGNVYFLISRAPILEIYRDFLGLSPEEIKTLEEKGVI